MGRYLCQLCYSIVHYGEKHPCFFYKNDDEVYTVPPPNESEAMGGGFEDTKGIPTGNSNDKAVDLRVAAQENAYKERKETNSRLMENNERISQMRISKRKTNHGSLFSPKFLCGMKLRHLDSTSASLASAQRGGNISVAEMSKHNGKIEGSFAETTRIGDSSSSETNPHSGAFGTFYNAESVSVAGPSGIQTQPRIDEKKKAFVCDVSGENFPLELHLPEHQRTETEEKTLMCHICSKEFTYKSNLTRHLLTHAGKKPFACDTCGMELSRKEHLEVHLRSHTGEKPFPCHICSKAFSRKVYLEIHLRSHSGEKPFKCKFCDKYFTTQSNCKDHQRRKHVEM